MKKLVFLLIFSGCLASLPAEDYLALNLEAALSVSKPEDVQKAIVDWVEARGGTYIVWSRDRLSLRLPREKAGELVAVLKTLPCRISGLTQSAEDVREQMADCRARIASRREALKKNMEIMGRTDMVNTLAVEQEVTSLIQEIEESEGGLRLLSYRARFAFIELSFHFRETARPENRGSAFPAVRNLDMYDFIAGMRNRYETKNR